MELEEILENNKTGQLIMIITVCIIALTATNCTYQLIQKEDKQDCYERLNLEECWK